MPCKFLYKNKPKADRELFIIKCKHVDKKTTKERKKDKKSKDGFPTEVDILKRTHCLTDTGGCEKYDEL